MGLVGVVPCWSKYGFAGGGMSLAEGLADQTQSSCLDINAFIC